MKFQLSESALYWCRFWDYPQDPYGLGRALAIADIGRDPANCPSKDDIIYGIDNWLGDSEVDDEAKQKMLRGYQEAWAEHDDDLIPSTW